MMAEHELDTALEALAASDARESRERAPAVWPALDAARHRRARRRQWQRVGLAVAATLVVGFGLGRWSRGPAVAPDIPAVAAGPAAEAWSPMLADLQARSRGLLREVSDGEAAPAGEWRSLASELLWATRRLLDDPATSTVAGRQLLVDLETVLTQILDVREEGNAFELLLVREAITTARLLERLVTPAMQEVS